jgi:SAM-dependent methyltransferase
MTAATGKPLTDKAHWKGVWKQIESVGNDGPLAWDDRTFDPILSKFLPVSSSMRALELGCFPGTYMAYMHRRFGYRVSGLDFLDGLEAMRPGLGKLGVVPEKLIQADFLTDDLSETWDVVASFGLLEHFADLELVVERQCRLVGPGGYVVIELPHFRGVQYLLHRAFDERSLLTHNLASMRPELYERCLRRLGFRVLTCDYFRTFEFHVSSADNPLVDRRALSLRIAFRAAWAARNFLRVTHLEHVPNRLFSPYIVVVGQR